uniref:AMP-dependent synthetase/ligase domain-containing protein n=1 Tax=Fibrocapsa japonica TaxID=94617 RepID=A0A7S2UWN0_9STRA|mmetsp:Transcript_17331/g.25316  ORF Transcript_17331/g.25316 Transcript_17331/m.25316 type:complete len:476 (+) Transcript_17331:80-1507(+)
MAGKTWTTDPKAELQPNLAETGLAANAPMVLFDFFRQSVKDFGDQPALFFKNISPGGDAASTPFSSYTWNEYYNQCITFAKALISLDFKPHTVSNIMGFNSKEWFISQFGTMAAGGIAAGIYPSNSPDQCQYISHHSEAEVVLLENNVQLEKYFQIANQLPKLKALVVWGEQPAEDTQKRLPGRVQLLHWDAFMQLGASIPDEMVNERIKAQKPGHCAVLVYTSGTTGPPKAVMISHDNATWTTTALAHSFPMDSNDITVSYLPLSHIAAQILDMYAHVYAGSKVYFAQPDALKGTIVQTLKEVRPTKFFGVPRVWEKMREKMLEIGRQNGACKSMIGSWAKDKGSKKTESHQFGGNKSLPLGFGLANKIAFSKVRAGLGLDRARDCFVAAAPISEEVLRYFGSLNIPIYEIFGQSECTGPHTLNTPDAWKIGTIGRPLLGSESRVAEGTGELQYRGRHIMMGYMKNPEATKKNN